MLDVSRVQLADLTFEPWPLAEENDVSGTPDPRIAIISRSADGTVATGGFRLSPGRFTFVQAGDEWTLVLKGRVVITAEDGSRIDCTPGDVMQLRDGATTTYEVLEEYEDYFVITNPAGVTL